MEEIVSDTFFLLWQNSLNIDETKGNMRSYLATIARNTSKNKLRKYHSNEVLNDGNADIKEIMTYIEASFKIDLGDYYRTYLAIRERKKDKTSFLTNLINKLLRKMDEDDKL